MITPFREKPNRIPVAAIPELEGARPPVAGVCSLCLFAASPADPSAQPPDPSQGVVYICPMDPDVRSHDAGVGRRCRNDARDRDSRSGRVSPRHERVPQTPAPGRTAVLQFFVRDPWKDRPVQRIQRGPRALLSRVCRERGSRVLRARAPVARRRRRVPVSNYPSQSRSVSCARRLLPGRRHAPAHKRHDYCSGNTAGACSADARLRRQDREEPARLVLNDPRAGGRHRPHADAAVDRRQSRTRTVPWRVGAHAPQATI